ncbi:protein kinase [Kitasatospora sp. NPDC085879]|uniref:serine/threonine-protein kinase n=1 Tax=Kitasatospora sp. NPDC085879 TaxID=3154769 RepID=UPI00341A37A4
MDDRTMDADELWEIPGYTYLRELGRGGCGRVVQAVHHASGTPVAVKYLTSGGREALRTEVRLLTQVRSPHVVRVHEYVERAEDAAVVMELVEGASLRELLTQEGPTGPEAALTVLKGSLLGLAAAHAAGVVHRDYKPDNILIGIDGQSKLVDFGIAAPVGENTGISGTPSYMSPEQWTGHPASFRTDVYAATAVFFECLTGTKPYAGSTLVELATQHAQAPIPDSLAPEALRPLVRRGLAKRMEDRPSDAETFVEELEAAAVAAYGKDWERRGLRRMAALLALIPLMCVDTGGAAAAQTTLAVDTAETVLPSSTVRPHRGWRHVSAVVAGAVLLAGAAVSAVSATGDSEGTAAARDSASAPDPDSGSPASPGAPSAGASGSAIGSSPSSAPADGTSPDSVVPGPGQPAGRPPGGTDGGSGGAGSGGVGSGAVPSAGAPPSRAGAPTSSPVTPTTSPTHSPPGPTLPAPTLHVASLSVSGFGCSGRYSAQATVSVKTDGAAPGTLVLTWFHGSSPGPGTTVATDRIVLPAGRTGFTGTYTHAFGSADASAYWGVQVTSLPAAATGNGTYKTVYADTCHPVL